MELKKSPFIESAERPFIALLAYNPNDYSASEQWALDKIEATKAWDITKGSNQVKIAISDVFRTDVVLHNELGDGKVVYNPNNKAGGHGQQVAGCAAALTDNGTGISSIGFNVKLMFVEGGDGSSGAQGINTARINGAHIINCSWLSNNNTDLNVAVYNALSEGRIITTGAGNDQKNVDFLGTIPVIPYPAAYNYIINGKLVQVFAITATRLYNESEVFAFLPDERWNYSYWDNLNYPTTAFVDFSAPGVFIKVLHDSLANEYTTASGTSLSAPIVAGLLGLIKSIYPNLTPEIAYKILKNTTDKVGTDPYNITDNDGLTWNRYMGYGRINAYKALKYTLENYGGTLTQDIFTPEETWNFNSGAVVNLNGYSIIGSSVNIQSGATINGLRAKLKDAYSSTYKGLCGTIQAAINYAGQSDEIHIEGGPYNENLNISNKNSISIYGGTINGTITATNSPGLQIFGTECNSIYLNNCTFPVFNNVNIYGSGSGTGLSLYNTDYNPGNMFNTMVWNFSTGFYASNNWCYLNSGNIFYENSSAVVSAYNSNLSLYYNELCNISGYHLTAGYGGYIYALECYYDNGIPRIFQNYGQWKLMERMFVLYPKGAAQQKT